jgi:hypothetical protein
VFFCYAGNCLRLPRYDDIAWRCLDGAIGGLSKFSLPPSLYAGYSGIAWAADYLVQSHFDAEPCRNSDEEDPNSEVDQSLLAVLKTTPWVWDYDLIKGLVGFGVYFLGRSSRPRPRQGLQLVVERLDETKTIDDSGAISWHTAPNLLPDWQRELNPDGYFNVGLAHGVPGVLVTLANAVASGVVPDRARFLLDGLVQWLRRVRQDPSLVGSFFPAWWVPGRRPSPSRHAWCYGDPGVGAAWLWSGILVGEPPWQEEAVHILRSCSGAKPANAAVGDAGLCHGAAGLGHLYNRVYQATGVRDFAEAARGWMRHALRFWRPDRGFGGYQAFRPGGKGYHKDPRADPWEDDYSFLTGSAGIALAYLAAVSDVLPEWDQLLLLSVPPRSR